MKKLLISLVLCSCFLISAACHHQADSARELYLKYRDAWKNGDFESSRLFLERIIDEDYPLPEYNLALVRNSLGFVYYETGHFRQAFEQYRIADSLIENRDPVEIKLRISIYNNLAILYNELGDYTNCLSHYDKALRLLDSVPSGDEDHYRKLSMLLFNKGYALFQTERFREALEFLRKSEQIKEDHHHEYIGSVYFNLARTYGLLDSSELAGKYFQKSINQWTRESGAGYYQLANVYLHYGLFLAERGETEHSQELLARALQNYINNYGLNHPLTSEGYLHLANFHLARSDFRKALDLAQLALISVSVGFDSRDVFTNPGNRHALNDLILLKCYSTKTRALEGVAGESGDQNRELEITLAALETNRYALEVLYRLQGGYWSRESRTYLMSKQKGIFTEGLRLNLRACQLTSDKTYMEQALLMAAMGKSNELLLGLKEKESLYLASLSDTLPMLVNELKQRIDHYSNLIDLEHMELHPDSVRLVSWKEQLFRFRGEYDRSMKQLRASYPQMERFSLREEDFSLEWIRKRLGRNESLLEYFLTNADSAGTRELYTFVVSKDHLYLHHAELDSTFHHLVERVVHDLHSFHPMLESPAHFDSLKVSLHEIYMKLVEPVEPYFVGTDLKIVPDEYLARLPFDALITQYEKDTLLNYAGLPYLLNTYNICYAYNTQTMGRTSVSGLFFPRVRALVPDYANTGTENHLQLKGTLDEAHGIMEITRGEILSGSPGKEEIRDVISEDAVIHIAMHARAFIGEGKRSYFLLNNNSGNPLANRLYDYEINAMNLVSPLVVLSSCSTGSGPLEPGEGIISLSRSFILGGASTVVHALWPVEDSRARKLMVEFYRTLKQGKPVSHALSRAKKVYIAHSPPSFTHPYYWATFQVVGDGAPLTMRWWFWVCVAMIPVALLLSGYLIRRSFLPRRKASF